jgi:hypothetical protein
MNRIVTEWRSFRTQVLEHRGQLALSLRVTIAALLSFVLSLFLHVPLPLWTVLTAVLLTQVSFGRSLKATIDYLTGTLSGAVYAGAVAALVPHTNEIALAGVLALVVAPLALLGAINPSFSAATFTGVLVVLVPGIAHVGPRRIRSRSCARGRGRRHHRTSGVVPGVANACLFSNARGGRRNARSSGAVPASWFEHLWLAVNCTLSPAKC